MRESKMGNEVSGKKTASRVTVEKNIVRVTPKTGSAYFVVRKKTGGKSSNDRYPTLAEARTGRDMPVQEGNPSRKPSRNRPRGKSIQAVSGGMRARLKNISANSVKMFALYLMAGIGVFAVISLIYTGMGQLGRTAGVKAQPNTAASNQFADLAGAPAALPLAQAPRDGAPRLAMSEDVSQQDARRAGSNQTSSGLPVKPDDLEVKMGAESADKAHTLYVFSDPNCSHCKRFESVLNDLARTGKYAITIFPVAIIPESEELIAGVSCAPNKLAAWRSAIESGVKSPDKCSSAASAAERSVIFFRAFGFNSTPTLISGDGRVKDQALGTQGLIDWLAGGK